MCMDEGETIAVSVASSEQDTDEESEIAEPPEGLVVFINDDYTTTDFVVSMLTGIFRKSESEAVSLMLETHEKGKAVIGVYALDVAVTRAKQTIKCARAEGFPLQVQVLLLPSGGDK